MMKHQQKQNEDDHEPMIRTYKLKATKVKEEYQQLRKREWFLTKGETQFQIFGMEL